MKPQTSSRRRTAAWLAAAGAALLLGTSGAAHAEPARYEIDPAHLSLAFGVEHVGFAKVLGLFRTARGGYRFDEASGALADVRVEVETASVFSNHDKRDDHIKGKDFLNSAAFPSAVFTASEARRTGERTFEIAGQLQLLGKTQPLTLQATWNKSADSPLGGLGRKPYVMGVSARGSVKRSAFGMSYAVANGWVGDDVAIAIEFEAVRQ